MARLKVLERLSTIKHEKKTDSKSLPILTAEIPNWLQITFHGMSPTIVTA
jgi:hypothetical protein